MMVCVWVSWLWFFSFMVAVVLAVGLCLSFRGSGATCFVYLLPSFPRRAVVGERLVRVLCSEVRWGWGVW